MSVENEEDKDKSKSDKTKVEFSPEQQTVLDGLINAAFAKAFAAANKQFEPVVQGLTTELQTLKSQIPASKEQKTEEKPKEKKTTAELTEDTAALRAQLDEIRQVAESLKKQREEQEQRALELAKQNKAAQVKEAFIRASEKVSFFDRMSEFDHMEKQLQLDESGQVVVINPATKLPRLNMNAQPMTLEEFVADYAKQKPWTVKAPTTEVAGGTGSSEQRKLDTTGSKQPAKDWSKMPLEDLLAEAEEVIAKQYER
jgi:hypothetical protein